jgi:hypothetical protein
MGLDEDKIYTIIPFMTSNNRPDEPYIILSQQILVTRKSSSQLIALFYLSYILFINITELLIR